jgi:MFS transporter, PAT family, beta-lactamase induction signal transducer AmpG
VEPTEGSTAKQPDNPSGSGGARANPWKFVPTLYFLQGIPNVIVTTMAVALYKRLDVPNDQIGVLISLMSLPWTIKPLWGPLVDNSGTKRGWILATQALIAFGLGIAAFAVSLPIFLAITLVAFFLIAFLSATHDIAADGFYLLALDEKRQAAYVGLRSLFFRFAMVFGSGFLVAYAGKLELVDKPAGAPADWMPALATRQSAWTTALFVGAGIYAIFWLYHFWALPKPAQDERRAPAKALMLLLSFVQIVLLLIGVVLLGRWFVTLLAWLNEALHAASASIPMLFTPSEHLTPLFLPAELAKAQASAASYLQPTVAPFAIQALLSLFGIALAYFSTKNLFTRIGMGSAAREYFSQERIMAVIAFILFYRFGESMISRMSQPFLLDPAEKGGLAVATQAVGVLWGTVGVAALAIGGILGGWVIAKWGIKRCIWFMVAALNLPNLFYLWLALTRPESPLSEKIVNDSLPFRHTVIATSGAMQPVLDFVANIPNQVYNLGLLIFEAFKDPVGQVIFVDQFGYGFGFAAFMVYLMFISQGAKFKTSHYAISTGLMALGANIAGGLSGYLQVSLGWKNFFIAVCLLTIPGMITLFFIPLKGEDIRRKVVIDD